MSNEMGRREDDITVGEIMRSMSQDINTIKAMGESTSKKIDEVTEKINHIDGRVNTLWDTIFGIKNNGHRTTGIVKDVGDMKPVVRSVEKFIEVSKWAVITFTGAVLVGIANLLIITF